MMGGGSTGRRSAEAWFVSKSWMVQAVGLRTFGSRPAGAGSLGLLDHLQLVRQPAATTRYTRRRGFGFVHDWNQSAWRHFEDGAGNPDFNSAVGGVSGKQRRENNEKRRGSSDAVRVMVVAEGKEKNKRAAGNEEESIETDVGHGDE